MVPPYTPGDKDSDACSKDKCCIWSYIAADMAAAFTDGDQCSISPVVPSVLAFDAATWNSSLPSGGADGSILVSGELSRSETGTRAHRRLRPTPGSDACKAYGISRGRPRSVWRQCGGRRLPPGPAHQDLCRPRGFQRAPAAGLLPSAQQNAPALLQLFGAKTFSPAELVPLMGAHSVSRQRPRKPAPGRRASELHARRHGHDLLRRDGRPETPNGVFRFPSDVSLARDAATSATWQSIFRFGESGPVGSGMSMSLSSDYEYPANVAAGVCAGILQDEHVGRQECRGADGLHGRAPLPR